MAAIDKIYGSSKEYDELFLWLVENHPDYCKHMYSHSDGNFKNKPIANFPMEVDGVLYLTCPLKWVTDRIAEQYGKE